MRREICIPFRAPPTPDVLPEITRKKMSPNVPFLGIEFCDVKKVWSEPPNYLPSLLIGPFISLSPSLFSKSNPASRYVWAPCGSIPESSGNMQKSTTTSYILYCVLYSSFTIRGCPRLVCISLTRRCFLQDAIVLSPVHFIHSR